MTQERHMNKEIYIALNRITQVQSEDICLGDVGNIYCEDQALQSRAKALKIRKIKDNSDNRYVMNITEIIKLIHETEPGVSVNSIGETDFIIDYHHGKKYGKITAILKTFIICIISFFGAAFAIMTFNNDVSVADVLKEIYAYIMGSESDGLTVMEISYSFGLAVGIIGFFNHFAKFRVSNDPTPLEVEMRLYEENVCKTEIDNASRKETDVDVS